MFLSVAVPLYVCLFLSVFDCVAGRVVFGGGGFSVRLPVMGANGLLVGKLCPAGSAVCCCGAPLLLLSSEEK